MLLLVEETEETREVLAAIALLQQSQAEHAALQAAAKVVQLFAVDGWAEDFVREAGGIEPLVRLVADCKAPYGTREQAVKALSNLACENVDNQAAVRAHNGLEPLVALACDGAATRDVRDMCRRALHNLTNGDEVNEGLVEQLLTEADQRGLLVVERAGPVLPDKWDEEVEFTQRLIGPADLDEGQRAVNREVYAPTPTDGVEIFEVQSPFHPCKGQRGLRAAKSFSTGERVVRYVGVVKRRVPGDAGNDYLYGLRGAEIDVDAERAGNESRFVNDFRGIAEGKNVQFAETRAPSGELEVWFEALCPIACGEEFLTSYGDGFCLDDDDDDDA